MAARRAVFSIEKVDAVGTLIYAGIVEGAAVVVVAAGAGEWLEVVGEGYAGGRHGSEGAEEREEECYGAHFGGCCARPMLVVCVLSVVVV